MTANVGDKFPSAKFFQMTESAPPASVPMTSLQAKKSYCSLYPARSHQLAPPPIFQGSS